MPPIPVGALRVRSESLEMRSPHVMHADSKSLTRFCWSALVKDLAQEELGPLMLRIIEELCR